MLSMYATGRPSHQLNQLQGPSRSEADASIRPTSKFVVHCSKCGVFMLTELSKIIGLSKSDKFEVKRVSLVKPLTSLFRPIVIGV